MKYKFELSSRTTLNYSVEKKHEKLFSGLKQIKTPWGVKEGDYPVPEFEDAIIAVFPLDGVLGKGIDGNIIYRYRRLLEDHSMDDDKINIEFNPKRIDYIELITNVFKSYIEIFEPYTAQIFNEEIIYVDFELLQNKNLRKDFIRFYPVNYFDNQYCKDALRMSSLALRDLLLTHVEKVELYRDGIIIISDSTLLDMEKTENINRKLKSLLPKSVL